MDEKGKEGPDLSAATAEFDNLLRAFDITNVGNGDTGCSEKTAKNVNMKDSSKPKVNGSGDNHVEKPKQSLLNTSFSSGSDSPERLKIDESNLGSDAQPNASTPKEKNVKKKTQKSNEKVTKVNTKVPDPIVIKEEKEDPGYNKALKNVITMTTPSPVVTTSIPLSNISFIPTSLLGKSPVQTVVSVPKGRPAARSLITTGASQLKIAPRPNAPATTAPKFAFIPVTSTNPRTQTSRTVTLYVPPNLLTPSGSGAIRLPSPQSLVELLNRQGNAITSQPKSTTHQAGLVNPQPRVSSQIVVPAKTQPPKPSGPSITVPVRQPTYVPGSVSLFNQSSREVLSKLISREHTPPCKPCNPPPELEFETEKHSCICGDEFFLATSLEEHKKRNSVNIRYLCEFCSSYKERFFTNPCSLMYHIVHHSKSPKEAVNRNTVCQIFPPGKSHGNMPLSPDVGDWIDLSKDSESTNNKPSTPKDTAVQTVPKTITMTLPVTAQSSSKRTENLMNGDAEKQTQDKEKSTNKKSSEIQTLDGDAEMTEVGEQTNTIKEPEETKYDACPYCKVILDKGTALEQHFQTAEKCNAEDINEYMCNTCNRLLPNQCSFQAHQAFHNKTRPFICPECGVTINGNVQTYIKHVDEKCLHNMHFLRFGCTKCPAKKKKKFSTRKQLLEHIEDHGETYVKCLHCPMAFRSMETLKDHSSKTHTITDITETDYKSIFKCALCDTVYQEAEQRRNHLATHNKDLKVFLVYRCNKVNCGANRVFITKVRIREHLQERHSLQVLVHLCDVCGGEFDSTVLLEEHMTKEHSDPNACVVCEEKCTTQDALWKHMKQHDDKMEVTPSETLTPQSPKVRKRKSTESSTSPVTKRVKSPPYVPSCQVEAAAEDSRFYCSDCKLKFLRQGVLQEHMRIVHSVHPQFPCHLCGATYDSDSKLQKHVKQHEGKAKEQFNFMCWICQKNKNVKVVKYTKRSILEKHLANYHKLSKSQIDWSNLKPISGAQSEAGSEAEGDASRDADTMENDEPIKRLKVDGDTQFTCAKCTFVCESRQEFLAHIPQHKTEDESHQCPECGMCFMVLPSLKRHLLVVHRIRDFIKYFQESGLNLETPPIEERRPNARPKFPINGTDSNKPTVNINDIDIPDDFECKVCYKPFDSEKALHNHMRVHGMAFIKSKRMDIPI